MPADSSPADHPDVRRFLMFVVREAEYQAGLVYSSLRRVPCMTSPGPTTTRPRFG